MTTTTTTPPATYCPNCHTAIWDKAKAHKLNKCHNCKLATDTVKTYDELLEDYIGRLDDSYNLIYTDYRDQFTSAQIADYINTSGQWDALDDSIMEWEWEARWESVQCILKEEFTEEEREDDALMEEVRYAIEERDNSNPIDDLLKNSSNHFVYAPISPLEEDESIVSYQYTTDDEDEKELKKIAKFAGIPLKKYRKDIEELYYNGASFSMSQLCWFFRIEPSDYAQAIAENLKYIYVEDPSLVLRDSWNGSGHDVQIKDYIAQIPVKDLKSDEHGNGYSYAISVCGLHGPAYDTSYTFSKS